MSALTTITTLTAYDSAGNAFQIAVPATPTLYSTAIPVGNPERGFELIPQRIFVGGFPAATTELELRTFFERYGHVQEAKVIRSSEGSSRGYGFITFGTEDEAKAFMKTVSESEGNKLEFKGRRLNLGPALRRIHNQYVSEYVLAIPPGQFIPANGIYTYQPSPLMLVQPAAIQPSFVCPPVMNPVGCTQFQFPSGDGSVQHQTNVSGTGDVLGTAGGIAMPHDPTRGNTNREQQIVTTGASSVAVAQPSQQFYSPAPTGLQQFLQIAPPLTPVTPSVVNQHTAALPQTSTYYTHPAVATDMMHYSLLNSQTYFVPANAQQGFDAGGQPSTIPAPAGQVLPMVGNFVQNFPQQCCDETFATWQNAAATEVHQSMASHSSPLMPSVSVTGQFGQMSLQQHANQYERRDIQGNNAAVPGITKPF